MSVVCVYQDELPAPCLFLFLERIRHLPYVRFELDMPMEVKLPRLQTRLQTCPLCYRPCCGLVVGKDALAGIFDAARHTLQPRYASIGPYDAIDDRIDER